jgi:uncharacterized protein (DUF2141 family)
VKIKPRHCFFHFLICNLIIFIVVFGCAKSVRPPGGPEDRTPPGVFATDPPSGAVMVAPDSRIIIEFSEPIDRNTAEKALFISPLPDPEPKIKVKSDAIIIIPRQNLLADKTYVVTIGTDLKDKHKVNLDQSVSIAFSTGPVIDSGFISGTVYRDGKGIPGVSLALFENRPDEIGLPVDSLIPDYFTQSGEGGSFEFGYLPDGTFFLIAFEDKNKNRRINPAREMVGLPFMSTKITGDDPSLTDIDIQMHLSESTILELRSVSVIPDRLLKVKFTRPLNRENAEKLIPQATLRTEDKTTTYEILEHTNLSRYPATDFVVLTSPLKIGDSCNIAFDYGLLNPQIEDSMRILRYAFSVPESEDQLPPVLLETVPPDGGTNIHPDSALSLRFSEILDIPGLANVFRLIKAEEESASVTFTKRGSFTFETGTRPGLEYGHQYRLLIDAPRISDRAGNLLSDSLIEISFTTIGLDTLGQLSGEILFSISEDATYPVVISIDPQEEGVGKQITVPSGQTQFITDLLPGYYMVSAFLDRNRNGQFDYGSIIPYELAEPFVAPADTFRVRTRFESAGAIIEF